MKSKKLFIILMLSPPIIFFFASRLLGFIIGSDYYESLKNEIREAVICGYAISIGIWMIYRKSVNKGDRGSHTTNNS